MQVCFLRILHESTNYTNDMCDIWSSFGKEDKLNY